MPWRSPQSAPFTRIGIVSQVPSESGVFGLVSGDVWLLVAESWNLKARLLDLINTLSAPVELTIVYELCPEADAEARCREVRKALIMSMEQPVERPPGISFWADTTRNTDRTRDGREI
jgi:hypothetical protein